MFFLTYGTRVEYLRLAMFKIKVPIFILNYCLGFYLIQHTNT
jgi:hypothetical protein